MQTGGSPLPGVLILVVVVIAAALLLVGLGVAVGTGLIVGIMLGLLTVGFVTIASRRNPSAGRLVSLSRSDEDHAHDRLREFGHAITRVADVDAGALTRVIPIGREITASGVRLEAIAAEFRTDGGLITLVTHTRPPAAPPGHFGEVDLTDDAGTEYVAALQGSGGSSPSTSRYELRFSPAPPEAATELTVRIARFLDPFPESPTTPVEGPWVLLVPLRPTEPR